MGYHWTLFWTEGLSSCYGFGKPLAIPWLHLLVSPLVSILRRMGKQSGDNQDLEAALRCVVVKNPTL